MNIILSQLSGLLFSFFFFFFVGGGDTQPTAHPYLYCTLPSVIGANQPVTAMSILSNQSS